MSSANQHAVWPRFENGIIAICSRETEDEVFARQLIALPRHHWTDKVSQLHNAVSAIFIRNVETGTLWGGFVADGDGGLDHEPLAFTMPYRKGQVLRSSIGIDKQPMSHQGRVASGFPAQCRFHTVYECRPLLRKAEGAWKKIVMEDPKSRFVGACMLDARQVQELLQLFKPVRKGKVAEMLAVPELQQTTLGEYHRRHDDDSKSSSSSSSPAIGANQESAQASLTTEQFPPLSTGSVIRDIKVTPTDTEQWSVITRNRKVKNNVRASDGVRVVTIHGDKIVASGQHKTLAKMSSVSSVSSTSSTARKEKNVLPRVHPPVPLPPEDFSNYPFLAPELYRPECRIPMNVRSCRRWQVGLCEFTSAECRFHHGPVVCREFQCEGSCRRGDACIFQHDELDHMRYVKFGPCEILTGIYPEDREYWESKPRFRDPRKVHTCNHWYHGRCYRPENECKFLHRPTICSFFQELGKCPNGSHCFFVHDEQDRKSFLKGHGFAPLTNVPTIPPPSHLREQPHSIAGVASIVSATLSPPLSGDAKIMSGYMTTVPVDEPHTDTLDKQSMDRKDNGMDPLVSTVINHTDERQTSQSSMATYDCSSTPFSPLPHNPKHSTANQETSASSSNVQDIPIMTPLDHSRRTMSMTTVGSESDNHKAVGTHRVLTPLRSVSPEVISTTNLERSASYFSHQNRNEMMATLSNSEQSVSTNPLVTPPGLILPPTTANPGATSSGSFSHPLYLQQQQRQQSQQLQEDQRFHYSQQQPQNHQQHVASSLPLYAGSSMLQLMQLQAAYDAEKQRSAAYQVLLQQHQQMMQNILSLQQQSLQLSQPQMSSPLSHLLHSQMQQTSPPLSLYGTTGLINNTSSNQHPQ